MQIELDSSAAQVLLGRLVLFAARDDRRPVLNGVLIEAYEGGRVLAFAADGFRMGMQSVTGKVLTPGSALIAVPMIKRALKAWPTNHEGRVIIEASEKHASIDYYDGGMGIDAERGVTTTGRLVEGTYPDCRQLIPKVGVARSGHVAINAELVAALSRLTKLDREGSTVTRWYTGEKPGSPVTMVLRSELGDFVAVIMPMFVEHGNAPDAVLKEALAPFQRADTERKPPAPRKPRKAASVAERTADDAAG